MNPNPNKRTNYEEYASEDTPIMPSVKTTTQESNPAPFFFESLSQHWVPDQWEVIDTPENTSIRSFHHRHHRQRARRSIRRRIFLLLTEPDTSIASAGTSSLCVTMTKDSYLLYAHTFTFRSLFLYPTRNHLSHESGHDNADYATLAIHTRRLSHLWRSRLVSL